jgi:phosphohistidine phosphatase
MRTLLVMRHAKSSWDDSRRPDHERPLNRRGERDAPRMGDLVNEQGLTPDVLLSSDAVRARTTAEAVAVAAGCSAAIRLEPRLYLAAAKDIYAVLHAIEDAGSRTVMIVGHNPGLEEFVAQLTGEREALPTAAIAHIVVPIDRWQDLDDSTRGSLVDLWLPRELS